MLSACSRLEKWVLLQRTTIAGPVPARCGGRVLFAKGRRLYYNAVHAQGAADGADIRAPLLLVSVRPAVNRLVKLLLLAALAILLYAGFLWPIPQHFAEGIPYGSYTPREMAPREMVQGDHLQLLYHFELLSSYLGGETPWFRNLWEFNLGDETVPARIDPCYAPFALPYAVLRHAGLGDAPAWNFCQWLSVWVGLVFCYLLARSHGAGKWASASIAAVALCVPYRWVTLAGGSPTGFGMGLVPGVALGIDWAVRNRSVRGGLLAGLCLLGCYAADLHCFLFAAVTIPLWGFVALFRSGENPFTDRRRFLELCGAALPVAVAGVLSLGIAALIKRSYASTDVSGGRTFGEIRLHSPDWRSFFDPFFPCHSPDQFHMGVVLPVLLLAAGAVLAAAFLLLVIRRPRTGGPDRNRWAQWSPLAPFLSAALLAGGILFAFLLALGVNGPLDALPLRVLRKLVPPFQMVRQPIKIFCLLPALYTAFFAMTVWAGAQMSRSWRARHLRLAAVGGLVLGIGAPLAAVLAVAPRMHTGVCLLPGANAAYTEAAQRTQPATPGEPAGRALILPVWPGDSSWSSIYQYYALRARLRMLNGYAAVKTPHYLERVFYAFETMTEGDITDAQLQALRELDVRTVILQENAWPEKVSAFPFGHTLRRFLSSPRLQLVAASEGAWTFALLDHPRETAAQAPAWPVGLTRRAAFSGPQNTPAMKLRAFAEHQREGYGWLVRGSFPSPAPYVQTLFPPRGSDAPSVSEEGTIDAQPTAAPTLVQFPTLPMPGGFLSTLTFQLPETTPRPEITDIAYAPTAPLPVRADGTLRLNAADLSHDFGVTVLDASGEPDGLQFRPGRDPASRAVHGPNRPLPLPAGTYRARLIPADPALDLRLPGSTPGSAQELVFPYDGTAFLDFEVHYNGNAPARLHGIEILPADAPASDGAAPGSTDLPDRSRP